MAVVGSAEVEIRPDTRGFARRLTGGLDRDMRGAGDSLGRGFGSTMARAASAAFAGVAVGAFVKGAVTAAADLERGLNEVFTLLPGASQETFDSMTADVQSFALEMGVTTDKVVPALYQSLSAGVPPDNVFDFLETAQKAAVAGVTDLETAVDGISSTVNAYGSDVIGAAEASDLMFTAVRLGKTTFEELSSSLFQVNPVAAAVGVGFEDITAGLAALTAQGVPTRVATTQLRAAIAELAKGGTAASDAFAAAAGKTFPEFIAEGGNLVEAFDLMKAAADEQGKSVLDLFGAIEGGQAVLALTGSDAFANALGEMEGAAGATEAAYEQMDQGLSRTLERVGAVFEAFQLRVGQALAPIIDAALDFGLRVAPLIQEAVGDAFSRVSDAAAPLIDFVSGTLVPIFQDQVVPLIRDNVTPILAGLGTALALLAAPAVVAGFGAIAAAIGTLVAVLASPIALIAALVAAVVFAYREFEAFREVVDTVFDAVADAVGTAVEFFTDHLDEIQAVLAAVGGWIEDQVGEWADYFRDNMDDIERAVRRTLEFVRRVVETVLDAVTAIWETHGERIVTFVTEAFDSIREIVERTIQQVRNVIDLVLAVINGRWGEAWDALVAIVSNVWGILQEVVDLALDTLQNALALAWDGILILLEEAWGLILAALEAAWEAIVDAVTAGIEAVIEFHRELPGRILDALGDALGLLAGWGADLLRGLYNAAESFVVDTLAPWVTGLPGRLVEAIGDALPVLAGWGRDLIFGLLGAAGDFVVNSLLPWLRDLPGRIVDAVGDLSRKLYQAGRDLVAGLREGFEDAMPGFIGEVNSRLNAVIDSALSVFGISSPSRVFREIGSNVMEGLRLGLASGGDRAAGVVEGIAARLSRTRFSVGRLPGFGGIATGARAGLGGVIDSAAASLAGTGGDEVTSTTVTFQRGAIEVTLASGSPTEAATAGEIVAEQVASVLAGRRARVGVRVSGTT